MSALGTFEHFETELARLVEQFGRHLVEYKGPAYDEANVRKDFLDPFFRALGWDMDNRAGLIPRDRQVEIESRTAVGGRHRRADYLFRVAGRERFVCEAKKPSVDLDFRHAFQAKRYAWNKGLPVALLTDFEHLKVFVVGGRPVPDQPDVGLWKTWDFRAFPAAARELWDLLSREAVEGGQMDRWLEGLPRKPLGKGRAPWVLRPDRSKALDADFLDFLDEARRGLASDLYRLNEREDLREGNRLNEAVHRILDRLLFLRICEDRDIDTGTRLDSVVATWRRGQEREEVGRRARPQGLLEEPPGNRAWAGAAAGRGPGSLWSAVVGHLRALDQRPPSHVPFFNGNLFKPHFSEELAVGDAWLAGFISDISDEESPYLFDVIPVEMLGTIYERFLGKVVRPHGRGVTVEEKPEVRKAGGVYYTPRYVVDHIVEETVGRLVAGRQPEETAGLRILDPACGSGSFLIRAYERMCEHWQRWLAGELKAVLGKAVEGAAGEANAEAVRRAARGAWERRRRAWCWLEEGTGDVHLTVELKRRILTGNIHGVDLDAAAVEVTQLSLYLKMLEGENRATLRREREWFAGGTALLPPLQGNIKCGNTLVASDFSMMPGELVRVNAFDWAVQFPEAMAAGGFDAVIGNPPYVLMQSVDDGPVFEYLGRTYRSARYKIDTYQVFMEKALGLARIGGALGFITPNSFLRNKHAHELRGLLLEGAEIRSLRVFFYPVFRGASVDTCILIARKGCQPGPGARIAVVRSTAPGESTASEIAQARWAAHPRKEFFLPGDDRADAMVERIWGRSFPLGDVATAYFGIQTHDRGRFVRATRETACDRPVVDGVHVQRYDLLPGTEFVEFRPAAIKSGGKAAVHEARRIGVRQIGRTPVATLIPAGTYALNTIYNIYFHRPTPLRLEFVLGILLSSTCRWFWLHHFYDQKKTFPKVKKEALLSIPIPRLDLAIPGDRARHDALVALVEKMLALVAGLRAARGEAERATLHNAVTATDRQIDAAVHALFGLGPEDVAVVEAGARAE